MNPQVPNLNAAELAILIIDDQSAIVEVLQRALQSQGYHTQAVGDASTAFDLLATASFDLILCDLELPRMNGVVFYQQLIENEPGWKERFILMTGEMLDPGSRSYVQTHHIPVLMKPFDLEELYQSVAKTLQGSG